MQPSIQTEVTLPGITSQPYYINTQSNPPLYPTAIPSYPAGSEQYPYVTNVNPQGIPLNDPTAHFPSLSASVPTTVLEPTEDLQNYSEPLNSLSLQERMLERQYNVAPVPWLREAYEVYKNFWLFYTLWSGGYLAIVIAGSFLPFLIPLIIPWLGGFYYATFNVLRTSGTRVMEPKHFLQGFALILPLLALSIIVSLAYCLGLIAFILPGIYLMVTLQFVLHLYIEYSEEHIPLLNYVSLCYNVCSKQFWPLSRFLGLAVLVSLSGILFLGIGVIATLPITYIYTCIAFREIFGLRDHHIFSAQNDL